MSVQETDTSTEKTKTNPRPRLAVHARIFSIQQTLLENDASNERLFVRVQWSDGDVLPVYTRAATMLRDIETLRKHRSSYKNTRVTIQSVKLLKDKRFFCDVRAGTSTDVIPRFCFYSERTQARSDIDVTVDRIEARLLGEKELELFYCFIVYFVLHFLHRLFCNGFCTGFAFRCSRVSDAIKKKCSTNCASALCAKRLVCVLQS